MLASRDLHTDIQALADLITEGVERHEPEWRDPGVSDRDQIQAALRDDLLSLGFHWDEHEREVFAAGIMYALKGRLAHDPGIDADMAIQFVWLLDILLEQ